MWSDATAAAEASGGPAPGHVYLSVYFVLGVGSLGCQFVIGVFLARGHLNATKQLYENLVNNVRVNVVCNTACLFSWSRVCSP